MSAAVFARLYVGLVLLVFVGGGVYGATRHSEGRVLGFVGEGLGALVLVSAVSLAILPLALAVAFALGWDGYWP